MADKQSLKGLSGEAAAYRQELERVDAVWKDLNKQAKENKNNIGALKAAIDSQISALKKQYGSQSDIKKAIKEATIEQKEYLRQLREIEKEEIKIAQQKTKELEKAHKEQLKNAEELRQRVQNLTDDNEEYLGLQYDISKAFGKTSDQAKMLQAALEKTKAISGEFASLIEGSAEFTDKEKEALLEVAETYATVNKSIIQAAAENKKGIITAKQYARSVSESQGEWDKVEQKVQDILKKSGKLKDITDEMSGDVKETGSGAKASITKQQKFDIGGAVAGAAAPESTSAALADAVVQAGAGVAAAETGPLAWAAIAMGAIKVGASAQELINKLNPRPILDVQRAYEGVEKTLDNQIDQLRQYSQLQAGIPQLKANLDFSETMAKNRAAFNAASKTALFGSGLGSPKYAKDQLQLAGISAQDIVSTMSELSKTAGSGMKGLGEDVAVFSKKTGLGAGELGNIINTIRIFDKTGGGEAFNTMQSSLSEASKEGFNLVDITNQLASSAELAAEFNMGSYKSILKQVEATRMLGMDMSKVAQAGKSMVLNYKDSIKAEMTLGAILGENVDLSQVRALFAAGRVSEAGAMLKASGLAAKAQGAGLFAVEALKQATGGLDLTQMNAAEYQKGPGVGIQSNAGFLKAFAEAQRVLNVDNAVISAKFALLSTQKVGMAEIGAEYYSKISEGITGLLAKQQQTGFLKEVAKGYQGKANLLSVGTLGAEGQVGDFNYGQYGFNVTKDMIGGLSPLAGTPQQIKQKGYINTGYMIPTSGPSSTPNGTVNVGETQGTQGNPVVTVPSTNDTSNATLVQILDRNHKTMLNTENMSKNSTLELAIMKNIEVLQGMMVNLTNPEFNLILDGKDITAAVTKRVINSTGTTKDPTLRVRGFQ